MDRLTAGGSLGVRLEGLLVGRKVRSGWLPYAVNGHCCENLNMAACAGFIGFRESMRLALSSVQI
jgi:hypothetical protein